MLGVQFSGSIGSGAVGQWGSGSSGELSGRVGIEGWRIFRSNDSSQFSGVESMPGTPLWRRDAVWGDGSLPPRAGSQQVPRRTVEGYRLRHRPLQHAVYTDPVEYATRTIDRLISDEKMAGFS